jgi:hypothetical protein
VEEQEVVPQVVVL